LQPKNNRDTKAELNRRSQVCETLAGTGVRVAEMVGHQGIAPSFPVWKVLSDGHWRVSLPTYARRNGINRRCWIFQKAQ
jgi:hypothetical protein